MLKQRYLPFIVATIFIDAIGFGFIMPVLPQLLMRVAHADLSGAISIGATMGLAMALATFFASPILGNLSDHFGRRPVLLIALAGLSVDYLLMALANTLPLVFVGRIISGIFGGSYGPAQAAIADITPPDQRARNFGYVGAAFGVGFVLGPALGGLLAGWGDRAPFYAASALAALNFAYGLFVFPETLAADQRRAFDWRRANPLGALRTIRAAPGMARIAVVLLLWQIASLVYPLVWSFYGIAAFGWSPAMIGASLAGVGVVIALSQGLITGRIVKRFGERKAAMIGLLGAVGGFVAYGFATRTWMAFAAMAFIALQSCVQPSLMALLTRRATPQTQGETQGISAMAMGLGSIVAPLLLTGTMAEFTGPGAIAQFPGAPFLVSAVFGMAALAVLAATPRVPAAQAKVVPAAQAEVVPGDGIEPPTP